MTALPRLAALTAVVCVATIGVGAARAQTAYDVQRQVEIAELRLHLYQNVEHPAEVRRLRTELTMADAEAESLKRLLREYEPFNRFSTGNPLTLTVESTRLALLRAELRRDNTKADLQAMQRHHAQRLRLLQLELQQAQAGL